MVHLASCEPDVICTIGDTLASLTIENYIKTIYSLGERILPPVSTGAIAESLNVSPGTVTSMLKTLSESGLVEYKPYEGVRLTEAGNALALRVLRRHRLIEAFLVETLNLDWKQVHEEAENLEHAVSDFLVDRIDQYLGYPETDPHGSPIPKSDGTVKYPKTILLSEATPGCQFRLEAVTDQSPEFLNFVKSAGLKIGGRGEVVGQNAAAATVSVRSSDKTTTVSIQAAKNFKVVIL